MSSAYATHTQALPSHTTLRQGGCSYSSSIHHRPVSLRATRSSQVQITPSPLLSIYLFSLLICLQWYQSLTCRPIFALWTWGMSSDKYRVRHEWQPQTWLHCLKSEPLPLLPARHKHTHNHPHLSLLVSVQGRQYDTRLVDLGLSITASFNASTCQRLDRANKPIPSYSYAHNAFPCPTVHRGWQFILALSLSVYDCV